MPRCIIRSAVTFCRFRTRSGFPAICKGMLAPSPRPRQRWNKIDKIPVVNTLREQPIATTRPFSFNQIVKRCRMSRAQCGPCSPPEPCAGSCCGPPARAPSSKPCRPCLSPRTRGGASCRSHERQETRHRWRWASMCPGLTPGRGAFRRGLSGRRASRNSRAWPARDRR